MPFTARQMKAIGRYAVENKAQPQLSIYPRIRFKDKDGLEVEMNVYNLVAQFAELDKSQAKEKAKMKRQGLK